MIYLHGVFYNTQGMPCHLGLDLKKKNSVALGMKLSPLSFSQGSFIIFVLLFNTGSKKGKITGQFFSESYKKSL